MIPLAQTESLRLAGINFGYGSGHLLRDVSFELPAGKLLTLLGPSGCGKTTLLKLIGGYLKSREGSIHLGGRDVTHIPAEDRGIGMVFQNYALFPHLSARRNVSFGLEVRGVAKSEREQRVERMLHLVGLSPTESDRLPASLSGGQQQRVALARALVFRPDLLLLDEPFANLDRQLRDLLRDELRRLQAETNVTAVMVTHDQEEAMAISDFVGVINEGQLLQIGSPQELYHQPRTPFVARFMGAANILTGSIPGASRENPLMVRPERVLLGEEARLGCWTSTGTVCSTTFLGSDMLVNIATTNGPNLVARIRPSDMLLPGMVVRLGIASDAIWQIPGCDPQGVCP